jgi:hypothetical protein
MKALGTHDTSGISGTVETSALKSIVKMSRKNSGAGKAIMIERRCALVRNLPLLKHVAAISGGL